MEVRVSAAKANLTIRDFVIAALVKACDGGVPRLPVLKSKQPIPVTEDVVRLFGARKCSTHGGEMKDLGTKWACDGPPFHTELKR